MPINTQHYGLEAFTWGDYYSASSDRRRFVIIDNQLAFISDMVGSGRILGWRIAQTANMDIAISSGMGMVGKRILESFGSLGHTVSDNTVEYIYMKAKEGVIGGVSGFSNIDSLTAVNITPPSSPSNLEEIEVLKTYNQLAITWDANTEVDFSHYIIYRLEDVEYGDVIELTQTTDTSYIDTHELSQDTFYTYRVVAVDLSGNRSLDSEITIKTAFDERIPLNPKPYNGVSQQIFDHRMKKVVPYLSDIYNSWSEKLDRTGKISSLPIYRPQNMNKPFNINDDIFEL